MQAILTVIYATICGAIFGSAVTFVAMSGGGRGFLGPMAAISAAVALNVGATVVRLVKAIP